MKNKLEQLIEEAESVRKKLVDFLYDNRSDFVFLGVDTHYVAYSLNDYRINIWIANGEAHAKFYDSLCGIELNQTDHYTDEMKKTLWNMAQDAINQNGEKRMVEKTQMGNDLFFKFKGVHEVVKFTGYDDADWWDKYKPQEIKEDENITWVIDWSKMEAVYKPNTPNLTQANPK